MTYPKKLLWTAEEIIKKYDNDLYRYKLAFVKDKQFLDADEVKRIIDTGINRCNRYKEDYGCCIAELNVLKKRLGLR